MWESASFFLGCCDRDVHISVWSGFFSGSISGFGCVWLGVNIRNGTKLKMEGEKKMKKTLTRIEKKMGKKFFFYKFVFVVGFG